MIEMYLYNTITVLCNNIIFLYSSLYTTKSETEYYGDVV